MAQDAEEEKQTNWLVEHDRHYLILSAAGKPIFSFHEDFGSSGLALCALLRALALKSRDKLEVIQGAQGLQVVFLVRSELVLVCCTHNKHRRPLPDVEGEQQGVVFGSDGEEDALSMTSACGEELLVELDDLHVLFIRQQLELLYSHVIFHVTQYALDSIVQGSTSHDLASLLGGTESEFRNLIHASEHDLSMTMEAMPVLPIPSETYTALFEALDEAREDLATFALLLGRTGHLIAGVGPRNMRKARFGNLFPSWRDFALLSNFVRGNPQLLSIGMETWTPVCLPDFNAQGQFHMYCSCIREEGSEDGKHNGGLFLLMLTTTPSLESFHSASRRRDVFVDKMNKPYLDTVLYYMYISKRSPADYEFGRQAIHCIVRVSQQQHGTAQFLESSQIESSHALTLLEPSLVRRYLVNRYAGLRTEGATQTAACRLLCDARDQDVAVYCREADLELMALFPPLESASDISKCLQKAKAFVSRNRLQLFSFPSS